MVRLFLVLLAGLALAACEAAVPPSDPTSPTPAALSSPRPSEASTWPTSAQLRAFLETEHGYKFIQVTTPDDRASWTAEEAGEYQINVVGGDHGPASANVLVVDGDGVVHAHRVLGRLSPQADRFIDEAVARASRWEGGSYAYTEDVEGGTLMADIGPQLGLLLVSASGAAGG